MQNKFTEQTNDYLMGIRFNNYKEWFHAHRDMYRLYVHEPMCELGDEVYSRMHQMDKDFIQIPKVSRANRDIRFSKNKNPYKESKWFFLRADGKPDIAYPKPTYFFEIAPDLWRYGLFFSPMPRVMQLYRTKIEAEGARFLRIVNKLEGDGFFAFGAESYKKVFKGEVLPGLEKWLQFRQFDFTRYEDYTNTAVYGDDLPDLVFEGFKKLYDLYRFLYEISYE